MTFLTNPDQIIESVHLSPVPMVLSNPRKPDNPLEIVNRAFCALTGYAEAEIIGRNCRFLAGQGTEPAATEQIRAAIRDRRPVLTNILNYRRDGSSFRNGVTIAPIFDADLELVWFLGSQIDLGAADHMGLTHRRSIAAERVAALSPRQREVLRLMARGFRNKQIAWQMKISTKTVEIHRASTMARLEVATSAEAIRIAIEAGL